MRREKDLLHTPEGVRDIYGAECMQKLVLEDRLLKTLQSYGYHPIETPTFEFFDVFGKEIGTTPSKDLYKFFDRDGETLVLRPDVTPQIARAAAKFYMDSKEPLRFCYRERVYTNNLSYQGRLRESTQIGAELLSDDSVEADGEILAMIIDCMKRVGIRDFQISIGHALFFQGLIEAAGIPAETEAHLRELIENKNFFGVEETIEECVVDKNLKELFRSLGRLYQNAGELSPVKELAKGYPKIEEALDRLIRIEEVASLYEIDPYLTYELGLIGGYEYYTGIVIAGFTYGSGEPIVRGGRYDRLLSYFGKNTPSIGFAFITDQILSALSRNGSEERTAGDAVLIVYDRTHYEEAVRKAKSIRADGKTAELLLYQDINNREFYENSARNRGCDRALFLTDREG